MQSGTIFLSRSQSQSKPLYLVSNRKIQQAISPPISSPSLFLASISNRPSKKQAADVLLVFSPLPGDLSLCIAAGSYSPVPPSAVRARSNEQISSRTAPHHNFFCSFFQGSSHVLQNSNPSVCSILSPNQSSGAATLSDPNLDQGHPAALFSCVVLPCHGQGATLNQCTHATTVNRPRVLFSLPRSLELPSSHPKNSTFCCCSPANAPWS